MLFLALSMLGYISYTFLPIELFPNAELPMLYVQISNRQEVTPEYMEREGVIPLEGIVGQLDGVESIEATAGTRNGVIQISYKQNVDLNYAHLKLIEAVNGARASLPTEFNVQVVKANLTQTNQILMRLQLRGSGGTERLRNLADQKITAELENIDGVAGVTIYGGKQKSIEIVLNKDLCDANRITTNRISSLLSNNQQIKAYTGNLYNGSTRFFVYVDAEYKNINDIAYLVVGNGPVLLKDVAEITFGEKEEETISRVNGKDAISAVILYDTQENIIDVSHNVADAIIKINEKYQHEDIQVVIQENQAEVMENNINSIIDLAITGGLLAIFVLWIFLRNIRLISIVALAIPTSVFTAFNFFYAFDVSLNSLTMVGMALAIGMLLDNSVVVLENIYRLKAGGASNQQAVIEGTKEVWRSIMAATLTTITVFLPFIFSSNYLIKLIGNHIGVSIISTLVVSLFVAFLLIPMLTFIVLKQRRKSLTLSLTNVSLDNKMLRLYLLLLKTSLRHPAQTIIGVLLLFFATIAICLSVSVDTLTEVDTATFNVAVTMPTGSTLETTDKSVTTLEERFSSIPEIEDVICTIDEEEASIAIKLKKDYADISDRNLGEIKSDITNKIKNISPAEATLSTSTATSGSAGISGSSGGRRGTGSGGFQNLMGIGQDREYIVIKGENYKLMSQISEDLKYYLEELENIRSVNSNLRDNQPEVHLDFNTRLMTEYGLTMNNVASSLATFDNEVSSGINFKQGTESYDIIIKYNEEETEKENQNTALTYQDLQKFPTPNSTDDASYELQTFSNIFLAKGLRQINRVNQEKEIELNYTFEAEVYDSQALLEAARTEIDEVLQAYSFPTGVTASVIHEDSQMDEFYFLIGIAFLLIFMILASVFESLSTPFVLMFSIPLAAIGSFIGLIMTGNSLFNANTLMGFLILLGVVVNNGIILIDFTNILRKRGYRKSRAIMLAGMSRVRPILITAITTCIAMLPLALGTEEYVGTIGAPFAITVIGGLLVSTLLTLVFIPTCYSGLESALAWFNKLPIWLKLGQVITITTLALLTYYNVESFIWQLTAYVATIMLVPSAVYFLMHSLKRASTTIISPDTPITIRIRNLVKIYGRRNQFMREWYAMQLFNKKRNSEKPSTKLLSELIWQLPLLYCIALFAWSYLDVNFWIFGFAMIFYATTIYVYTKTISVFIALSEKLRTKEPIVTKVLKFSFPLIIIYALHLKIGSGGFSIFTTIVWYTTIATITSSRRLKIDKESILQSKKGPIRWWYLMLSKVPVLSQTHTEFKALKGVSFDIQTGMFGLLGPNGAGKSTMMRTICGIYEQSYGKIWINEFDTAEKREELQGLIGFLPQEFGMYENMTAWEYLNYQSILKEITDTKIREERIEYVLKSVHMFEKRDFKIGGFSGGMKQRIGIAQILLNLPRILVVDEPTAGLDPRERIRFRNLLVDLSRDRIVIFSTHVIEDISSSCNHMAVINKGELKYLGAPAQMTHLAEGHVWRFWATPEEFNNLPKSLKVVHHMKEDDKIRVRCLSENSPFEGAQTESPLLEDAYLWLLRNNTINN